MTLQKKTILIISITITCLVAILILAFQIIFRTSVKNQDENSASQTGSQVFTSLSNEMTSLNATAANWAISDDTYWYMLHSRPNFEATHFDTLSLRNNAVNLYALVDQNSQVVLARAYDSQFLHETALPQGFLDAFAPGSPLLIHLNNQVGTVKLLMLPDGPVMVAIWPIIDSNHLCPVIGTLIEARYLNPDLYRRWLGGSRVNVQIFSTGDPNLPADISAAIQAHQENGQFPITPINARFNAVYSHWYDAAGEDLILRVEVPRDGYQSSNETLRWLIYISLGTGVVMGLVILFLLERTVLRRISFLNDALDMIGRSGDFSSRIQILQADEVSGLEKMINQMLTALGEARRKEKQQEEELRKSHRDLVQAYDETIQGWSRALELRDQETEGHARRVTELTVQLARSLGVPEGELIHIRRGALLHDIGKMGIPDAILLKPGKLDPQEWEEMKRHTVYGYQMLLPIAFLRPAIDIPHAHHERWDGKGYPRGLKGSAIPLAARIFAIVDVWDALRSDRPYHRAWSDQAALDFIRENSGTQFDPQVAAAFFELLGVPTAAVVEDKKQSSLPSEPLGKIALASG